MMQRTIFPLSIRSRHCNTLLNVTAISSQGRQMPFSTLPFQYLVHGNYRNLVSSMFSYIVHRFDFKFSYSVATNQIQNLTDLIMSEDSENVDKKRSKELEKILTYLLSKGYTSKAIREKFLIYLKSKDISYAKFNFLEDIDSNITLLLPLVSLPKSILKLAAQNSKSDELKEGEFTNRIYYLCHHLELEPSELIPALVKHSTLLTMNFKRLDDKMNILKAANISPKYIVKDLWIFNYKEQLIANRIQAAVKAGVELRPWMLRCSEKIFQSILIKNSEAHRILGSENIHSYLAKRLDCNIDYINYLMERNKLLKTINIPKLEQIIDCLYAKGYTPQEVRLFPRVFCSSVLSLEKKFEELQYVKSTLPTIAELCMSKKKIRSKLKEEN